MEEHVGMSAGLRHTSSKGINEKDQTDHSDCRVKLFQHMPANAVEVLSGLLKPRGENDWRSLAGELDFSIEMVRSLDSEEEPVIAMFKRWQILKGNSATVQELLNALAKIRRLDCIEDIMVYVNKTPTVKELLLQPGIQPAPKVQENGPRFTVKENYDVFISYAKEDIQFARFLLMELREPPYNFNVCIDYQDFLPGENELDQIADVIENRCRKVIVILTDAFTNCEMSDFQAKLALSLSPACRRRKLIPVLYKLCSIPSILRFISHIDYSQTEFREFFWTRLTAALENDRWKG